jgi:hypothetical protein
MKANRYNFNKSAKLNLLCPNDSLRPSINCIYFNECNAIATDGHALLVVPVKEISTLTDEDIDNLNGKLIDRNDYKDLLKFDVIRVEIDGIVGIAKTGAETKYLFRDYGYPDYKAVINGVRVCDKTQTISFKGAHVAKLCEIMDTQFITLEPNGNGAIKVSFEDSDANGLIMPCYQ